MDNKIKIELLDTIKYAIIEDDLEVAKDILEKNPELFNCKTRSGGTLLHDAALYGRLEFTKFLLDLGMDTTVISSASGNCGTALTCARTPEIAQLLMNYGIEPIIEIRDEKNPLFFHLRYGNVPIIRFWLNYELDKMDNFHKEELIKAVVEELKIFGHSRLIEELGLGSINNDIKAEDFSLKEFEKELVECIKYMFHKIQKKYNDEHIYAFSLANTEYFDSLFFVANTEEELEEQNNDLESKYFEENWGIWEIDDEKVLAINEPICSFIKKIENPDERIKFSDSLIDIYIKSMKQLRDNHFFDENLLLNVYVRDYLSDEEMINIYQLLNKAENSEEYLKIFNDDLEIESF